MKLLVYTKKGKDFYRPVNDSLHLALSEDGKNFHPLKNDTGVLFPEADFSRGGKGETVTLRYPYAFAWKEGFAVACVLYREEKPDPRGNCIAVYRTEDFVFYSAPLFLKAGEGQISFPEITETENGYEIGWEENGKRYHGQSSDLTSIENVQECATMSERRKIYRGVRGGEYGNAIEIAEEVSKKLKEYFSPIRNAGMLPLSVEMKAGETFPNPKATFLYSDGSTHEKEAVWDTSAVDFSRTGEYVIKGKASIPHYPFPYLHEHISDPCITKVNGKYFLTHTCTNNVIFRMADSLEGLQRAEKVEMYRLPSGNFNHMWAQELHHILGTWYVFTTVATPEWYTVRSHILRCVGDPADPKDWEAPRLVVKENGEELNPDGISLDMTYFEDGGRHYVMWSNRVLTPPKQGEKEPVCEPADIYIATVHPEAPWVLSSAPVCVIRPKYGWDRLQTEVDEGPYLLRRGEKLFVTISGSSTAVPQLYCLGLLEAKSGADLLNPENWTWYPFPVLTKESVKGQLGPGHNNFVREKGDDLLVFHAVKEGEEGEKYGRQMAIRRVHWGKNGLPYFAMTEEDDLPQELRDVSMTLKIV